MWYYKSHPCRPALDNLNLYSLFHTHEVSRAPAGNVMCRGCYKHCSTVQWWSYNFSKAKYFHHWQRFTGWKDADHFSHHSASSHTRAFQHPHLPTLQIDIYQWGILLNLQRQQKQKASGEKNALFCVAWNTFTKTIEIIASVARSWRKSSHVPNYNHTASRNAHL